MQNLGVVARQSYFHEWACYDLPVMALQWPQHPAIERAA